MPAILADRYQLAEIVYSDADVVAYRAQDQLLSRMVTVELLQGQRAADPRYVELLVEKARRAALSELPHVAALYDQHMVDGRPFVVWEELGGPSLAEAAPLTVGRTIALAEDVAETLRVALEQRRMLPAVQGQTVRLVSDERTQIIDLGLGQYPPDEPAALRLIGDLLHQSLAGTAEHRAPPLQAIAARAASYPTLAALLADLRRLSAQADQPTTVVPRPAPTIALTEVEVDSRFVPEPTPPARPTWGRWAAIGVAALLLLALLSGLLLQRDEATADQTPGASAAAGASAAPGGASGGGQPGAAPGSSPAAGTLYTIVTNNGQSLVIREGPGRGFARITSLPSGTIVEVIEGPQAADGFNWVRIRTAEVEGWCVREALRQR